MVSLAQLVTLEPLGSSPTITPVRNVTPSALHLLDAAVDVRLFPS